MKRTDCRKWVLTWLLMAVGPWMVSCAGGSTVGIDGLAEADVANVELLTEEGGAGFDSRLEPPDGAAGEAFADDQGTVDELVDSDEFGTTCSDNSDCVSGICTFHLGERVCSRECVEECPSGFLCQQAGAAGPDVMFLCTSEHPYLCLPCSSSDECKTGPEQAFVCVTYGVGGSFCGAPCDASAPCPQGYVCLTAETTEGNSTQQCVAQDDVCECTDHAVEVELFTTCVETNEFGECAGERGCLPAGLAPCNAPVPAAEECNGVDDDCNGETDDGTCDDGNPCTEDSCLPAEGCVHQPLHGVECDDGDPCTVAEVCQEGACAGTLVTCDDDNQCTEDLCDQAGGCLFQNLAGPCDDEDPCTVGDSCQEGACVGTAVLCECEVDADCVELEDGNLCNGTLVCLQEGVQFKCVVDLETVVECPEPDGADALCQEASCQPATGNCSFQPANSGLPCDDGNPCTVSELCSEGVCGSAVPMNCNDGNPCSNDSCQPEQGCVHGPNSASCDDGDPCTLGDGCSAGECLPGEALTCDDSNPCTNDLCNPLTGCLHTNNSEPCDDLDPCTQQDQCSGGLCLGSSLKPCDDGNPCTNDVCIPLAGCSYNINTNPCDDNNPCTVADHCLGAQCSSGQQLGCDDGNPCTDDSCDPAAGCLHQANSADCDDQNSCTVGDQCSGGICLGSGSLACDDGNPCTEDGCLPDGGCAHENVDGDCSDGDPCTVGDQCVAGVCQSGDPFGCDDGNPCTEDSCSAGGLCEHVATVAPCDDGNACTTQDVCSDGVCIGGEAKICDDESLCTSDYCDPGIGCSFVMNEVPCDDGSLCTYGDHCHLGQCIGGAGVSCDDGNPCTTDSCNSQSGCVFSANDLDCDDGNACTENDGCSGGWCAGSPLVCDDDNICTQDGCNPESGCVNTSVAGDCDDGDVCTLGDSCVDGECFSSGTLTCEDGNLCTDDVCDPVQGCQYPNNDDVCDDSDECTVGDFCQGGGCQPGPDPLDCDDNDPDTTDSCDPDSGCQHSSVTTVTYSQQFVNGQSSPQQCVAWGAFRAQLSGDAYSKITIKGTYSPNGVSCSGPMAQQICHAMHLDQKGTWNCNGRVWAWDKISTDDLTANGGDSSCKSPAYTVRPCINNPNWGGADTASCGAPSQTLEVVCE
jgi:hypothetical protein